MSYLLSTTKNILHRKSSKAAMSVPPPSPVTIAVIGCGQRGRAYADYALQAPEFCKVVAIAEPRPKTRSRFQQTYDVDNTLVFNTWQELHAASEETQKTIGSRLADAVVVAVQDQMHKEVVLAFAAQGYHILCEKPMATDLEDLIEMEEAVARAGILFGMGHVMRYSPYSRQITDYVQSGTLGKLVNIVQVEPVGYFHFAHSYVRGNWATEKSSSFSLMTKCCHDIDLICFWMTPSTPARVSSFGSLQHFRKSAKPREAGSATRCLECPIEKDCAYSAKKIYLDAVTRGNTGWPVSPIVDGLPDIENVTEALTNGPYGQCVYESPNDVCDHQVVNLEFSDGSTASFTMVAYTSLICDRQVRLHFTNGEIVGDMTSFTVHDFRTGMRKSFTPLNEGGGHGGGDLGLIRAFVQAVRTGRQDALGTTLEEIVKSHITVFAAELSRREGRVVDCTEFERTIREKVRAAIASTVAAPTMNGTSH
ncbi:GFO-IDH-MocA domain-containing protein [Mycena indigotica]|uniref:GFO-IDH-MocA domain-containing protein n=1 Tax=Mycena indigotica TaxID=2126181 RepID=A0A8H6SKH6_9AGAR|nr:GFO-IDH-MocA domain-containing protein [Mycena indigotica]KAF7301400.1 GFO-IDH-MocA domain-containing protein [Mycena indigotica]